MTAFPLQVRGAFARHAADYEGQAALQRGIAWRLARLCRNLPPPPPDAPRADLGAGSGLLSRALLHHCPALGERPLQQLDLCPELLARNPLTTSGTAPLVWDLNSGLPAALEQAGLLVSSFALQWLEAPARELERWGRALAPSGWLAVAVPVRGSFPQWHQAAAAAGVPCTALELPDADDLIQALHSAGLPPALHQRLRFSRPARSGLATLRRLRDLGAGSSRKAPLSPSQLRRLLRHWPPGAPLSWDVLLLVGGRIG
ncbi:methyltransferase domain-containing protein [Cyanobium sp. FGCU-6]|jgi:malonyl-CoA O-methyltransferase|nr:methyltransferase domain-containing protein [Cyanobium sp. FGCU6]